MPQHHKETTFPIEFLGLAAAAGVSLNGVVGGSVALDGQWAGAALTKRGAEAWVIQGALAGTVT